METEAKMLIIVCTIGLICYSVSFGVGFLLGRCW